MLKFRNRGSLPYRGPCASAWNKVAVLNNVAPSLYHDYANQRYYDSAAGYGAFPFSSVRTTNAMQFDSLGRLVWAPVQQAKRGNDISNWDTLSGDGTISLSGNTAPTGEPSYNIVWTAASPTIGCTLTNNNVVVGSNNTFSVYLRYVNTQWSRIMLYSTSTPANSCRIWVDLQNKVLGTVANTGTATGTTATVTDVGGGWIRVVLTGNSGWSSATDAGLFIASATADGSVTRVGNGATIEVSSALLEPTGVNSPQTWRAEFDTTGAAWYGPRFDYNPLTLASRGIQVEESRTNLQPISQGTTASWTANFSTITNTGATIAGNPAYTFTTTATSGQFAFVTTSPGALAASTRHTSSVRVKRGNHPRVQLTTTNNCFQPTVADAYANYNFDTDTLTVAGSSLPAPTGSRQIYADGSVVLTLSYTSGTAPVSGAGCIVSCVDSDAATRLAGTSTNGATFHVLGVQVEANSSASSYIPTFGTASTRAADNLSTTSIGWLDQTKGTFYCQYIPVEATDLARRMIGLSDGTSANSIQVLRGTGNQGQVATSIGGVSDFNPNTAAGTYLADNKIAARYASPNKTVCINGNTPVTASTAFPTSGFTTLRIGSAPAVSNYLQGWIKEVRYYPDSSASDAQLQTLTT